MEGEEEEEEEQEQEEEEVKSKMPKFNEIIIPGKFDRFLFQ